MHFIIGGEALLAKHLILDVKVSNHYGPTETTIGVATYTVEEPINKIVSNIPIGKALKNTRIYILNKEMDIMPIATQGEIYIGGLGVAFGYVNQAGLTAEKFIANPFRTIEERNLGVNSRLYKTGDFAKYLPDGNIEFLGRKDEQVKIRGYRVELKEIEEAINTHGDIKDCMVIVKNSLLIAYIVSGEFAINAEELELYLEDIIPKHMIPHHYVMIDRIPLTIAGKRNKDGLPIFSETDLINNEEYEEAQESVEKSLCEIWQEILSVKKIGRNDNFFKLGGHSLLVIKLISRIKKKFTVDIRLIDLFDNPTISEMRNLIQSSTTTALITISIPPLANKLKSAPLSFAQHRLWFLEKLIADVVYNMPVAFELLGALDRVALRKSLASIVQRHKIFRTVFKEANAGDIRQVILQDMSIYEEIDLTYKTNQQDIIDELKEKEAKNKFDLQIGPLCRIKLLILNQEKHILIMTKHHIISDGWSFRILFKEITEFYAHYAANKELLLPKLKIQYIDYSVWQRNWFKNEQLQQQITYWQSKLMDAPINTTLPSDKMRPKEVSFQGRHHLLKVDLELSKKIEDICQRNNISIYMFFLTILNILIYKVTGDQDLVIGRLVTGRQHEEIENLIGLFVNTSVIRSYITRQKSFKKLLLEVKNNLLESYQFQDIPFEKLINLLKLDRVANQNPLFQILIDFKDLNNESSLELEGIAAKDISANYDIVKFDLEFIIYKLKDNSLAIRINYLLDIFHYKTIKRFAEFFENIVKNVVDNTEISIGNINIASVSEQNTQINLLNKGKLIYENQQPILFNQLFAQNITTNPDRIAVWDKGKFITYKELDRKINCLIAYFYNQGVKPSEYIAYCGPRDVDAVIAMLAIFKLGAIYVPIDRNYPDERISFILLDSEAKWLITSTAYHDKFKKLFLGEIILIDSYKNINHNNIKNTSIKTILEHNLAYLIYTSGTTGRPKGVMISHYSMAIRLASFDKLFKLQPEDKVAQQASLSFDVSLQEILCPLTSGAAIYFVVDETVRQPDDLIDSIEQNQITFIEFIPSFLQNLLISYNFTKNNSINKIVVGGEPLTSSLIEIFNSKLNAELINMCGPTEVCMDATYWLCDDKLPKLGTPLEYTHAYILDHDLNITPRDFAGELYFSTQAMARGYKGKAKLTAEKFIADIFTNTGNRLYKSGDIVKLLPDGNLDFLGRKDFQLKIRGYRVEIEEIEKILENYPDIKQIAITYKKHSHNNNYYLLCYYSAIKKIEDIQIINYIERYLPDYMIPSAFVFLISMPTTINGKVDKQALPEFILSSGDYYHAPKNKIEKILCEIWQDVLGINKVGTKDNFFRLGGDSIITLQILSKARRQSINFKLKDLFNHPEISSLSKFCQFIENNKNAVVSNKKIRGVVALTPIQSDFFNQVESYNYFNQSIVLSYLKELNIDYMQEALSAIIMHHDMLRAQYSFNKNKPTQVKQNIIDKVNFVFSYKDLSQNIDPFRMLGKEFNTIHTKINIFTPKLIGMGIYFLGKDKGYRIFITIHHLVIDEVSWRILKEDLEKAYSQLLNKEKINFDYKTTSFQKWSYLIKDYISEIKGHEKTFWQKLDNSIKKDYYNYKVRGIAKELVKNLDNTFTNRLLREVNKAYQTEINDILLTAMSLAYADWYLHLKNVEQQLIPQEIIIDLEGHGREILAEDDYTDLSRTIGWFTSI
jgi:bacitracin synthase 3